MLKEQSTRVITFFAADFRPEANFQTKLSDVAGTIERSLEKSYWQAQQHKFVFRSEMQPLLAIVDHRRLAMQTLGYSTWTDSIAKHGDLIHAALEAYGVKSLTRIGFKVLAWLDVEMSSAEQLELLFGSFLPKKSAYPESFGKLNDALVHLEGLVDDLQYRLTLTPHTPEQAEATIRLFPNRKSFTLENGDYIPELLALQERIGEYLSIDIDVFATETDLGGLRPFLSNSFTIAEKLVNTSVRYLKSIR